VHTFICTSSLQCDLHCSMVHTAMYVSIKEMKHSAWRVASVFAASLCNFTGLALQGVLAEMMGSRGEGIAAPVVKHGARGQCL
jgi:hypothetical protein